MGTMARTGSNKGSLAHPHTHSHPNSNSGSTTVAITSGTGTTGFHHDEEAAVKLVPDPSANR